MRIFNILVIAAITVLMASCKDEAKYNVIQKDTTNPQSKVYENTTATHKVVVTEFKDAGSYTYVKVVEDDKEFWVAIPKTDIKIGKTYYFNGGTEMQNFKSKELNKTFEKVLFLEGIRTEETPVNNAKIAGNPHGKSKAAEKSEINIEQPKGGTSIKDLFANTTSLSNKEIIVKGKVVKINKKIMGKNWVHLQDGTNFNGKSDLTVTTLDSVKVGDIATFKGVITLNKDFGQGYVYPVLMEKGVQIK